MPAPFIGGMIRLPDYRRTHVPGGTYFFTVNTCEGQTFLTDADVRSALRDRTSANELGRTRALIKGMHGRGDRKQDSPNTWPARSTTIYNSECPVCNAGIKAQRGRMEGCGIEDIEWVDVHTNPEAVSEVGASLEQVRERLHVKDSDGQINVGADAFTYLWSQTRGQRRLAKLVRLPVLKQLTRSAYNLFARLLYRWNRTKGRW